MKQRSKKAKGTRLEKWCMDMFNSIGWKARKQPLSGALIDFPHDVYAEHPDFGPLTIECKSWKNGWRTGDTAMGKADALVIKRDYGEPCVYMPFRVFAQLVGQPPENAAPAARLKARDQNRQKMSSRPFPTNLRKRMSGKVERR